MSLWHPSSMLALSVSLSPKLRVTTAEMEYMPFYLRTFFREYCPVGCAGENSWSRRGVVPDSTIFSFLPTLPIAALLAAVFEVMLNGPGVT